MPSPTGEGKDATSANLQERPPNHPEAERYVLRAMLRYPECVGSVRDALTSSELYFDAHQRVYRATLALADAGAPIDAVGVADELERRGWTADLGGGNEAALFLADLLDGFASAANVAHYVRIVKGYAVRRAIIPKARDLLALVQDEKVPLDEVASVASQAAEALAGEGRDPPAKGWAWSPITTGQLMSETEPPSWLIKRVMVKGQPAVIGAPQKAGKTSFAIDMALSLAAGEPFLNYFDVYRPVRVAVVSGESGRWTIMNHARQVCQARGIDPQAANVCWQFDLPRLSDPTHLRRLADGIRRAAVEVVIIDPLYLCLLSGAADLQASNLYPMGPLLLDAASACLGAGATPVLLHHTNRPAGAKRAPLELGDLAFSGIAEFARQWLLLNRREPFVPGEPGKLWMSVGGSCGQGGEWAVDVDEGTLQADFSGRRWDVTVTPRSNALEQRRAEKEHDKKRTKLKEHQDEEAEFLRALDSLDREGNGTTMKAIRTTTGFTAERYNSVRARLIRQEAIEAATVKVKIGNGGERHHEGIRRKAEHGEHESGT